MKRFFVAVLGPLIMAASLAGAQSETRVIVTGERVNLRAKADPESEVVGQVNNGDSLYAKSFQDQWVEVMPPENVDLWVHRDFIKDNIATASKLYVRAGASINYSVVGTLQRGDAVTPRGEFGEWIRIVPPAASSLWVSRSLVRVDQPERPTVNLAGSGHLVGISPPATGLVQSAQAEMPAARPPAGASVPAPAQTEVPAVEKAVPPSDLVLIPLDGQGRSVQRDGVMKNVGFVIGRPSPFRLVRMDGSRIETICYVRGNSAQLASFLNRKLVIRGREYWVQGVRYPVVVVEQISVPSSM